MLFWDVWIISFSILFYKDKPHQLLGIAEVDNPPWQDEVDFLSEFSLQMQSRALSSGAHRVRLGLSFGSGAVPPPPCAAALMEATTTNAPSFSSSSTSPSSSHPPAVLPSAANSET